MIDDSLREELSALFDGVLPEERAKELRKRIREDAELSREYAELERAVLAVRALPRRGAPAELRARLDASLGAPRAKGRIFRLAGLAAAAVVLMAVGIAVYLRGGAAPTHFEATGDERGRRSEVRNEQPPADPAAPAGEALDRAVAKDDTFGGKAAPREAAAKEDASGSKEAPREAAAKEAGPAEAKAKAQKLGAQKKQENGDLLAAVLRSREVKAPDRKAYLRQVAALGAEKARAHVLAVFGRESDLRDGREFLADAPGRGTPVLATILLEDREEAELVKKALAPARGARGAAPAALAVEVEAKDRMDAEIEGTPGDLRRIARWLSLLDLSPARPMRPKVTIVEQEEKSAAQAPAEEAQAEEARTAVVQLRYGQPPEPQPAESPPGK